MNQTAQIVRFFCHNVLINCSVSLGVRKRNEAICILSGGTAYGNLLNYLVLTRLMMKFVEFMSFLCQYHQDVKSK